MTPTSKSFIKMLNKIDFKRHDLFSYRFICNNARQINYSKINHFRYIDIELMTVLNEYPFLYYSKLMHKYSEDFDLNETAALIEDTVSMANELQIKNYDQNICACKTIKALQSLHDKWVEKLNNKNFEHLRSITFPLPPYPETETIKPICNAYDLAVEGKTQKHCVRAYQRRIENQEYYAYKVIYPERATLGLVKKNNDWQIDQIQLRCNGQPSEQTIIHVKNWFYENSSVYNSNCHTSLQ
jgi:hypothetical protein